MELEIFKSTFGYYNFRMRGGRPTEEMISCLKENGYRWSRNNSCRYPATDVAKEQNGVFSAEFRERFFPVETGREEVGDRIAYLEELVAALREERRRDKEKIASLEGALTEKIIADEVEAYEAEQSEIDHESEWERENTLTDEEEAEIAKWSELENAFSGMRTFRGKFPAIKAEVKEGYRDSGTEFTAEEWQTETVARILEENLDFGMLSESAEEIESVKHAERMEARLAVAEAVARKIVGGELSVTEMQEAADRLILRVQQELSERLPQTHTETQGSGFLGNGEKTNPGERNAVVQKSAVMTRAEAVRIRERCREILKKPDGEITETDKETLAQYEGAGGLYEEKRTDAGILSEFYTPGNLVEKVWQIADAYAPEAKTVLEPSAGTGRFADNRPDNVFTMHELDETSARINRLLHPEATVIQGAFQRQFFDDGGRAKKAGYEFPKYDVVIGNPPYGAYSDKYKGLGEGREFDRYEEYFIARGIDSLKDENSVMVLVVPSGFLNSADDKQKRIIAEKGTLVDAYRLPERTFPTTEVGTDIVVFKKQGTKAAGMEEPVRLISGGEWFRRHPEKILGETNTRTNRFGREEQFVVVHEGLSVQDELDKITAMLMVSARRTAGIRQDGSRWLIDTKKIENAYAEAYPDNFSVGQELAEKFAEAVQTRNYHDLARRILWNGGKNDVVARKLFEEIVGDKIPEDTRIAEVWLAGKSSAETVPEQCTFTSKDDVVVYIAQHGSGQEGGKERIEKAFAEYEAVAERAKFLSHEYGDSQYSVGSIAFRMDCTTRNIKVTAFITSPLIGKIEELNSTISYTELAKEIGRQIAAGTYNRKADGQKNESRQEQTAVSKKSLEQAIYERYIDADIQPAFSDKEGYARKIAQELAVAIETKGHDITLRKHLSATNGSISHKEKLLVKQIFEENTGTVLPEITEGDQDSDNAITQALDEWERPVREKENLTWLVSIHGCDEEPTAEILHRLYDIFPRGEAFERSKVLPIAFGKLRFGFDGGGKNSESELGLDNPNEGMRWKVGAEELETIYGIFDPGIDYHTVWDREWASRHGMSKEDVARLVKWDYSIAKKHRFIGDVSAAEKSPQESAEKPLSPIRPQEKKDSVRTMTAEEFSRLYGRGFDAREFPIWRATDWQGEIDITKLSAQEHEYLRGSENYVEQESGRWTHRVLFTTGNIYAKIKRQEELLAQTERQKKLLGKEQYEADKTRYEANIALLESVKPPSLGMERIHFGVRTALAEEFKVACPVENGGRVEINLQESFILWAQNRTVETQEYRWHIDYATANILREELGEKNEWSDIVNYIDGKPVKAKSATSWETRNMDEEEKATFKAERKREADMKRQARADTANRLFDRYLHEGLDDETRGRLEAEYNRRFNSYIVPDYSKLPLFVDGMSTHRFGAKFRLYDQQIKGISFLCNKGNGLLDYDVGVGKTAAGIVATVNQIQTGRANRPLIIVPNQVYETWHADLRELFPGIKVNRLYNFSKEAVAEFIDKKNPNRLVIPPCSISLCTYEALKNITFSDRSCEHELFEDFSSLLSVEFDGSERENAGNSEKIKGAIGAASYVKDASYYFFEECGFDNLAVDEAHNFKNLWTVPRPKKRGESNEYAGIPSGKPSARALKMYAMTQLVQRHNNDRNVFMLTATPFTNSPLEVYSMLSYIGRRRLREAGITSLRSFLDEFAQTKQELGVTADGSVDTRMVMKSWKELPALQNILMEFIDKVDGDEAGIIRPKKFTHVKPLDMSDLQKQMRMIDEARMAEVKEGNSAAVIVAMNNMRLACVAPALSDPAMYPGIEIPPLTQFVETSPKLKFVCDTIIDMYKDNPEKGQFMYVPLGKKGHGIIKDYLVAHGIPKNAVEIINGEVNSTPEKKDRVTGRFNNATDPLKIIIGGRNTAEGINLNGNTFVMYNCSLGWNPSETVQAEGRIWRQGNMQGHVHIVYPVMNDSIDSVLYQKHDEKRSRINELWSYKGDSLNVEDINPEDLKIDLIKDPSKKAKLILQEETKEAKAELSMLNLKIKSFDSIMEKRKQVELDFTSSADASAHYERQTQDYKDRGLEVPAWLKETLKDERKKFTKAQSEKSAMEGKLLALGIENDDGIMSYVKMLGTQKRLCEEKIRHIEETLPEVIRKLKAEQEEQKLTEYPPETQREILEADILNNLRPMGEVESEIRTVRFETMLTKQLEAGDITQEEFERYKTAGYEQYERQPAGESELYPALVGKSSQEEETIQDAQEETRGGTAHRTEKAAEENSAIPEKRSRTKGDSVQPKSIYEEEGSLFYQLDGDIDVVHSPGQPYFNEGRDDAYLTPAQLTQSETERDRIVFPILNGKPAGMYKAFKDFARRGIFDVRGAHIDMTDSGGISKDGWTQLHAAMNIYRSKEFETFRYVLIDRKSGEISDQLAVNSYMPDRCVASLPDKSTIAQVISRAEERDCLVAAVHNHPSGNVTQSWYDAVTTEALEDMLRRSDRVCRFAGHIILDHDTFGLYTPETGWRIMSDGERVGRSDEMADPTFILAGSRTDNTATLAMTALKINDMGSWSDEFIPVVFSNAENEVTGIKLYERTFFDREAQQVRNEFQFSGIVAGAAGAFPVVTEALARKLPAADFLLLEKKMKELVECSAFTDAVLPDSTVVEKYGIAPGKPLFDMRGKAYKKPDIEATWEARINPALFPQMQHLKRKPPLKKYVGMEY